MDGVQSLRFFLILCLGVHFGVARVAHADPAVVVRWQSPERTTLEVLVGAGDMFIDSCTASGLELRVRYTLQLCSARRFWRDRCSPDVVETRSLKQDTESGEAAVMIDRWNDPKPPLSVRFQEVELGLREVTQLSGVGLSELIASSSDSINPTYLAVRVNVECKGEMSRVQRRLSEVLTFGLVEMRGEDSGWINFSLSDGNS